MAQDLSSQLSQQARDLAAQDPVLAGLIQQRNQQSGRIVGTNEDGPLLAQIAARYRELGIELPTDYAFNFDPSVPGGVEVTRSNYFTRNADWILPAAVGGGVGLAALAGGGAAATIGGGTTLGSTGAAGTATGVGLPTGVAGANISGAVGAGAGAAGGTSAASVAGPAAVAGGVKAASALGSIWDHLPTIIGAGTAILGTKMQSDAVKDASKTQSEAADKALALQREMFDLERADNAPYRNLGNYAVGGLGHLVGMPENYGTDMAKAEAKKWTPQSAVTSAAEKIKPLIERWQGTSALNGLSGAATQAPGSVVPQMDGAQLAQSQTGSSYVQMEAPTGERKMVPEYKVAGLEQRGARRV